MIDNLIKRPFKGKMICIDPGSAGTGIALFAENEVKPETTLVMEFSLSSDLPWIAKCNGILDRCEAHLKVFMKADWSYVPVFIEEPKFFDSYTGITAAKTNSLAKLLFFFGRLWEITVQLRFQPIAVPIVQWKGQLNKGQVQERVRRQTGKIYHSHDCDAVGIGLWIRGKF